MRVTNLLFPPLVTQPNICVLENIQIDPEDLSAYMDKVGRDLFSGGLQGVVNQWEEADNFGSLIRPLVTDVSEVLELLRARQMGSDLFLAGVHQKVLKALRQADYLSPSYHVVVANPPYMGAGGMNSRLKDFCKTEFDTTRSDLFAACTARNLDLASPQGYVSMITMHSWMFIASFAEFREEVVRSKTITTLAHLGERAFDTIGGAVVATAAFVIQNVNPDSKAGIYFRLIKGKNEAENSADLLARKHQFNAKQSSFSRLPDTPIAYWIGEGMLRMFDEGTLGNNGVNPATGLQTGDNPRFIRKWYEVSARKKGMKWFPLNDGGEARKWYGNFESYINWEDDGTAIKAHKSSVIRNPDYYFQEGGTWTRVGAFSARHLPPGFIFDQAGDSYFCDDKSQNEVILGFLNSKIGCAVVEVLCPTLNVTAGSITKFPFPRLDQDVRQSVKNKVGLLIQLGKADWDVFETSWDFQSCPILSGERLSLERNWRLFLAAATEDTSNAKQAEESLNRDFIDFFDLNNQFSSEMSLDKVSLSRNPAYRYASDKSDSELEALLLADTMREFISYAVGCILGRYSLDKPGLILANQGETADDYRQQIPKPTFAPDEDNVIPLLDGDWFTDDISERFKEFLKVAFGTEHYEENLTFLENGLYSDNLSGKKRKTIRDYFLKDFYNHHIKLYQTRPIYWLFSSPNPTSPEV
ncbi:MAG: BREX-1 system adenine-specific DNA-methyltransferase PglX [Planctomycetaceae bacterium]